MKQNSGRRIPLHNWKSLRLTASTLVAVLLLKMHNVKPVYCIRLKYQWQQIIFFFHLLKISRNPARKKMASELRLYFQFFVVVNTILFEVSQSLKYKHHPYNVLM